MRKISTSTIASIDYQYCLTKNEFKKNLLRMSLWLKFNETCILEPWKFVDKLEKR
jgi:hypothetical protein